MVYVLSEDVLGFELLKGRHVGRRYESHEQPYVGHNRSKGLGLIGCLTHFTLLHKMILLLEREHHVTNLSVKAFAQWTC